MLSTFQEALTVLFEFAVYVTVLFSLQHDMHAGLAITYNVCKSDDQGILDEARKPGWHSSQVRFLKNDKVDPLRV